MKRFHIFSTLFSLALMLLLTGCDSEKEFNLIEGSLPIKTSTLYVVGDATPTGWNIDAPTPLTPSADDELVFTYEGVLYKGEIKLCLTPGSWDAPFIRPVTDQTPINKSGIAPTTFDMHAGDPDNKWRVTEAGEYKLTFDMRNWTMAAEFVKELDGPTIVPIETDAFYIVGEATPAGWNIDAPYALTKTDAFTFVYEGDLKTGELKAVASTGDWNAPFVRPSSANVAINKNGVAATDFVYSVSPDDKWVVEEAGNYRLSFDLKNWTIKAEYLGEATPEEPGLTRVYIVGDATPNGWNIDTPTELAMVSEGVYEFNGPLKEGEMKACRATGDWGVPFMRPEVNGTLISSTPIENVKYAEWAGDPDNKWIVSEAGDYRLVFNLNEGTFSAIKQ